MKKLLFILFLAIYAASASGQSNTVPCITCDGNRIDFTKGASAIGTQNLSSGVNALATGYINEATGNYSIAGGYGSKALGNESIALGKNAKASGIQSFALGLLSEAAGSASLAIGAYTKTSQNAILSIALGSKVTSVAERSMTIGYGLYDTPIENNISNSLMIGFNSDRPTFFVGSSAGIGTTGRIGIGNITAPTAKLHIKADINEDAAIMLQPTGSATTARIFFGDNNHSISAKTGENLVFKTGSGNHFVFTNGRVGIGTNAPTQTLDVQGTLRVSTLSSTTTKMIVTTSTGTLSTMNIPAGDNLGNHIATQNINMNGKYLSGDGTNKGMFVNTVGNVGIGTNTPGEKLEVAGTIKATTFSGDGSQLTNLTGDNLGNHIATQNINLNGKYLSGTGANNGIFVNALGNVGIGTNDAQATLHVNGDVKLLAGNVTNQLQILSGEAIPQRRGISLPVDPNGAFNFYIHAYQTDAAFNFVEALHNKSLMTIQKNGSVGIGTTSTNGYLLAVAGKIRSTEVTIEHIDDWYDCVFEEDYPLTPLAEIEQFVKQNKHLPEVPSEAEVKANGIDLGEMNAILLKKIEELTLHVIQQQKEIDALKQAIK